MKIDIGFVVDLEIVLERHMCKCSKFDVRYENLDGRKQLNFDGKRNVPRAAFKQTYVHMRIYDVAHTLHDNPK